MSIASELARIVTAKEEIKVAVNAKGGTIADETIDLYPPFIEALQSGGGGGAPSGDYLVTYFDYDGTILKEDWVKSGQASTPPSNPNRTSEGLTFHSWNHTTGELSNVIHDLDVGAHYETADGKTHAFIEVTPRTGLDITLFFNKPTNASALLIEWGDGTTTETPSDTGFQSYSKTYSTHGKYVVKISRLSGTGKYFLGHNNTSTVFCGGSSSPQRNMLYKLFIGSFNECGGIGVQGLTGSHALEAISLSPNAILFGPQSQLDRMAFISFPINIEFSNTNFSSVGLTRVSFPRQMAGTTSSSFFGSCTLLKSCVMPNNPGSISTFFSSCTSLIKFVYPTVVSSGIMVGLPSCRNLSSVIFPSGVTGFGTSTFQSTGFEVLEIPSSVTSLGSGSLTDMRRLKYWVFNSATPPTIQSDTFTSIREFQKIYVPNASLSAYKTATNWVTLANHIYPISELG